MADTQPPAPTDAELDELRQANSGAADLRDTLINIAREIEALKRECGMNPESPIAIQNGRYMALSYKVRALAAGQATAAQQGAAYAAPPEPDRVMEDWSIGGVLVDYFTADQMRAYVDADRAMRAAQPGAAYAALMQAASDWICEHVPTGTRGSTAWATKLQDAARALRASHGQAPAQPAQGAQEAQEPVAWYVTGCGRLLDEDEAKAEARHIGGTARAIPLYTTPQADSVLEDAALLDWLDLAGPVSICLVVDREHDGEVEVSTDDVTGYGKTVRAAIDAARATQEGKK